MHVPSWLTRRDLQYVLLTSLVHHVGATPLSHPSLIIFIQTQERLITDFKFSSFPILFRLWFRKEVYKKSFRCVLNLHCLARS